MEQLTVRYPDSDLKEFKSIINNQLSTAREEAKSMMTRLHDLEKQADSEGGHSFGEDSKNHEDREFLTRMYERQMEKIHNMELALHRIANKTYGVDENTGQLIRKERLMAAPTATTVFEN